MTGGIIEGIVIFTLATFQPGNLLTAEGTDDGVVYLLLRGRAEVRIGTSDSPVATLGPGETVGEVALLGWSPPTPTR